MKLHLGDISVNNCIFGNYYTQFYKLFNCRPLVNTKMLKFVYIVVIFIK